MNTVYNQRHSDNLKGAIMKWISTKDAAEIWGLHLRTAQRHIDKHQAELGAQLVAGVYMLDEDKVRAFTPPDPKRGRKPSRKQGG